MAGRTAKYYKENPEANKRRLKQQSEYNKTEKGRAIIIAANAGRRLLGLKKGDVRDASHTKDGKVVAEHRVKNRARNGANGKSTKK
jgi:hypothetical protein